MTKKQEEAIKNLIETAKEMIQDNLRSNVNLESLIKRWEEKLKINSTPNGKKDDDDSINKNTQA